MVHVRREKGGLLARLRALVVAKRQAGRAVPTQNAFALERAREKEEAKKAREREPASPTGDTPPAKKGAGQPGPGQPDPSAQDRFCLNDNAQFVRWVSLDVLVEKNVEKY